MQSIGIEAYFNTSYFKHYILLDRKVSDPLLIS